MRRRELQENWERARQGMPLFRITPSESPMDYDVIEARYLGGYRVWLRFRDGTHGEIDLESRLRGLVFEPLKDVAFFRRFTVHPEAGTLVWPNGADIAPETLHDNVRALA